MWERLGEGLFDCSSNREKKSISREGMAMVFSSSGSLRSRVLSDVSTATPSIVPRCAASTIPMPDREDDVQVALKLRPLKRPQRWQWSKGDAPGEYGGPPLDFRIRRTSREPVKDPITSTDDYIWKKDWRSHLAAAPSKESSPQASPERDAGVGFLSLNRAIALDSIDIDLSQELSKPARSILELQVEALRDGVSTDEAIKQDKTRWRMAPTRREQKQWERGRKAAGMAMLVPDGVQAQKHPRNRSATTRHDYGSLKKRLLLLTAVIGGTGAAIAYVSYSSEVAISYGIGFLGALAYIRMLANSVDSVGTNDAEGAVRGALAQPRILVPVVLVMFFNRWNDVLVPEYGFAHLQLIPILTGFFTYKAATLAEVFGDILQGSEEKKT